MAKQEIIRVAVGINVEYHGNSVYVYDGIVTSYDGKDNMLEELRAYHDFVKTDIFYTRCYRRDQDYDWYTVSIIVERR